DATQRVSVGRGGWSGPGCRSPKLAGRILGGRVGGPRCEERSREEAESDQADQGPPLHHPARTGATSLGGIASAPPSRVGGPQTRICLVSCWSAWQKPPKRRWQSPRSCRLRTKAARSGRCPEGILAALAKCSRQ